VVDCGVRVRRGWLVAGVLAAVLAGEAMAYAWIRSVPRPPTRADTVSLHQGRVTFRIPPGWQSRACGSDDDCVKLRAPRGNADTITVDVYTPSPAPPGAQIVAVATDLGSRPGARSFMVDGVRFVQWRADATTPPATQPATTTAMGSLPDGSGVFVWCVEKAEPRLVRSGCTAVLGSLHVGQ
jgi:hypothetical protein